MRQVMDAEDVEDETAKVAAIFPEAKVAELDPVFFLHASASSLRSSSSA